jgi:hypothetical protein
MRSINTLTA